MSLDEAAVSVLRLIDGDHDLREQAGSTGILGPLDHPPELDVGDSGLEPGRRDRLAAALKAQGIPTAIYYAKPLHRQEAYSRFPVADNGIPVTDRLAAEVISLPMHAYLDSVTQDRIIEAVIRALQS